MAAEKRDDDNEDDEDDTASYARPGRLGIRRRRNEFPGSCFSLARSLSLRAISLERDATVCIHSHSHSLLERDRIVRSVLFFFFRCVAAWMGRIYAAAAAIMYLSLCYTGEKSSVWCGAGRRFIAMIRR